MKSNKTSGRRFLEERSERLGRGRGQRTAASSRYDRPNASFAVDKRQKQRGQFFNFGYLQQRILWIELEDK